MGDRRIIDKRYETQDTEALKASAKLLAESQIPSEVKISPNDEAKFGVDRDRIGDQNKFSLYTQYPNGVRMTRLESRGLLKPGQSLELEPPPGGTQSEQQDGSRIVKDAFGKVVAKLDNDKTLHVYTKHGEFIERSTGDVTYKPKDSAGDWRSLHKSGPVSASKFEDYGLSGNEKVTRFPNGIEYDRNANKIKIPIEHFQFSKDKQVDEKGNLIGVTVYGSDGKVLYTQDAKGLHVQTADGVLTQTPDGKVIFESSKQGTNQVGRQNRIEMNAPKKEAKQTDTNKPWKCNESSIPLCGLEEQYKW